MRARASFLVLTVALVGCGRVAYEHLDGGAELDASGVDRLAPVEVVAAWAP